MGQLYSIKEETLTAIADSVRAVTGTTGNISPEEFAVKIVEGGSDGNAANALFAVEVKDYSGELFFEEYVPFTNGMTWYDFVNSQLIGYISVPHADCPTYTKIRFDDEDDPETRVRFYFPGFGAADVDYSHIRTSNREYVKMHDVIHPFVEGDNSTFYLADWD